MSLIYQEKEIKKSYVILYLAQLNYIFNENHFANETETDINNVAEI